MARVFVAIPDGPQIRPTDRQGAGQTSSAWTKHPNHRNNGAVHTTQGLMYCDCLSRRTRSSETEVLVDPRHRPVERRGRFLEHGVTAVAQVDHDLAPLRRLEPCVHTSVPQARVPPLPSPQLGTSGSLGSLRDRSQT